MPYVTATVSRVLGFHLHRFANQKKAMEWKTLDIMTAPPNDAPVHTKR